MEETILQELQEEGLITEKQYDFVSEIESSHRFSLFYESKTLLYLGVLLFTTGIGFLIYQNIGQIGHFFLSTILILGSGFSFYYAFKKGDDYSRNKVVSPNPYFDYILLAGSLLFLSGLGYIDFLTDFFYDYLGLVSLVTASIFFFLAYRFDHLGLLTLGITALTSFFGISVTPQNWYEFDFFDSNQLHFAGLFLSISILGVALYLNHSKIKQHFTYTYINYSAILFCASALAGTFNSDYEVAFAILQLLGTGAIVLGALKLKRPMLLVIGSIAGYVALTYLFITIIDFEPGLLFFYLIFSAFGLVTFIIRLVKFNKSI